MPNLNIPLDIDGFEFYTLFPDGSEFFMTSGAPHCNTIGERKKFKWKFDAGSYDLEGVNIWAQLGLFQQGITNSLNAKIPICYQVSFPTGLTPGIYPMALTLPVGANYNLNFNATVSLEIVDDFHFNIIAEFFQIYDETAYQNQSFQDNHSKLLKDKKDAPNELTINTPKTCYNDTVGALCMTLRVEKPNVLFPPDTYPYTMNANPGVGIQWKAGFYNRNEVDDSPYFNTPVWEFKRMGVAVTNLSTALNTDVKFKITSPTTVTNVLFWIIRTDKTDNTVDMFDNYEANFEEIVSTNTNIGLDKLTTPVINVTAIGGGVYEVGCSITADKLTNLATYRLIAIVYEKTEFEYHSNTFISDPFTADSSPCYNGDGFIAKGTLSDYDREFDGNDLECAIEERMKSKLKIEYPFNMWRQNIYDRLGMWTPNDMRRYLKKIEFEIYDELYVAGYGVVRNYYERKVSNKIGINTFSSQSNLSMIFSDNWLEFAVDWRNRFENFVDCIETTVDHVPVMPVMAQQYWGGKTLKIRWALTFFYDDYKYPFEDEIEFFQQIRVKDYGTLQVQHYEETGERIDFDETVNVCKGEQFCMAGVLSDTGLINRKLMVNICPEFGTVNSINEAESWIGNELPQMTTPLITNEEEDFSTAGSQLAAKFCIETENLSVNSYKITAFAKKYVEVGFRVSEEGDPSVFDARVTDTEDERVVDNI